MALLVSREIGCHRTVSRETLGNGRPERNRTSDSPLRRRVLFLLSYGSISRARAPIRRFSRPVESTLSRAMRPSLPRREGNTVGRTSFTRRAGPRGPGGGQTPSIRAPRRATHAGHTAPDARAATSDRAGDTSGYTAPGMQPRRATAPETPLSMHCPQCTGALDTPVPLRQFNEWTHGRNAPPRGSALRGADCRGFHAGQTHRPVTRRSSRDPRNAEGRLGFPRRPPRCRLEKTREMPPRSYPPNRAARAAWRQEGPYPDNSLQKPQTETQTETRSDCLTTHTPASSLGATGRGRCGRRSGRT